ncbi:MAG: HIT family protein [Candidatus Babeliales bacterium]
MTTPCLSCALTHGTKDTIGGVVTQSSNFQIRQDYSVPISGFMILATKRHIKSIDEFTKEERLEFIELLYNTRQKMKTVLGIETIYLIQEEDSAHFHLWLFPRYSWMENLGQKLKSVKPIMEWAQQNLQTSENIKEVKHTVEKLKKSFEI